MKVALYARYSSDNQRDASIADQLRICRIRAEREGWRIIEEYTDHAVSGASLLRPGIQALITDALAGRFEIVLAEAMDRLSRDQEDIAGLFKRMTFVGVKIVTLSEGEVGHLHVGLKGTMNALFLRDLADKTRRGQRGRVEQGKSGGGNAYGYRVVRQVDTSGEPERGDRAIDPYEAEIVRRIFRDFVAGKSGKRIASDLNREKVRAPGGGDWGFSTINGNVKRGTGILNNTMYIGRLVWNRQRFVKDPDTGRRQARPNPPEEWITVDVPELRIIDDALWQAAKQRQVAATKARGTEDENHFRDRRRPKYLFSGLTKCGCCGGGYTMISTTYVGCAAARNKGTCGNRVSIRRDQLEARVLNALRHHLMDPDLFQVFCDEFTRELNRLRGEVRSTLDAIDAELAKIDRELDTLLELILKGGAADRINAKMVALEARKTDLETRRADAREPPPLVHPEMAGWYRKQIAELHEALREESEEQRLRATEAIRSLVDEIVLTPAVDRTLTIDVRGDLAGILTIAAGPGGTRSGGFQKHESRPGGRLCEEQVGLLEMVAGAGSNLYLLPEQVKMVAGTGVDHNLRSTPAKMVAGACTHLHLLFRTAA